MMKKIICLILALTSAFALFACGEDAVTCTEHKDEDQNGACDVCGAAVEVCVHVDENKDGLCDWCETAIPCVEHVDLEPDGICDVCKEEVEVTVCLDKDSNGICDFHGEPLECKTHKDNDVNGSCDVCGETVELGIGADFFAAVKNSKPTSISTMTTLKVSDKEVYTGRFNTVINEEGFVFDYNYTEPALAIVGAGDRTATVEGVVYYANGQYSEDGENWTSGAPDVKYLDLSFKLTEDSLGEYKIAGGGKTLTSTLDRAGVKKVFGIDVNASEFNLEIKLQGAYLGNVKLSYTTNSGYAAEINTSYVYAAVAE